MRRTPAHSLDYCSTFTRYVAALQHFHMVPTFNLRFTEFHVTKDDFFVYVSAVKKHKRCKFILGSKDIPALRLFSVKNLESALSDPTYKLTVKH